MYVIPPIKSRRRSTDILTLPPTWVQIIIVECSHIQWEVAHLFEIICINAYELGLSEHPFPLIYSKT